MRWERCPQQTLSHILAINTNNFTASVEAVQIQQLRLVHGRYKKPNSTTPKQEDICVHFKAAVTHRGENGTSQTSEFAAKNLADFSD